jgi:hypothetical protein
MSRYKDVKEVSRFSLRKTSLGLASAMIAVCLYAGTQTVHADTVNTAATVTTTNTTKNPEAATETNKTVAAADQKQTVKNADDQAKAAEKAKASDHNNNAQEAKQAVKANAVVKAAAKPVADQEAKASLTIEADGKNNDVIDVDKSNGRAQAKYTIQNPNSSKSQVIDNIFYLTAYNNAHQAGYVLDRPFTVPGTEVLYSLDANTYVNFFTLLQTPNFNFDFSKVVAFKFRSNLAAGQSVTVNIPLRLRNFDQLKKDLNQIATGTAASDLANANLRKAGNLRAFIFDASNYHLVPTGQPSVQLAKIIAHSPAKNPWIATTLKIDAQGNRQYYAAPAEVQNAIPQDLSNYVSFTDAYGNPTNEFYTDGHYKLDLNAIFNWIKGLGYSVNVNSDNSLWQDYSYNNNPVNNTNWTVDTKPSDQVPEKQQTNSYFEVQKVFTTKDLKLANGANWNSNDNLAAASIYFTDKVSMKRVGSKNLM